MRIYARGIKILLVIDEAESILLGFARVVLRVRD
jgi:hypothetical protein